MLVYIRINFFHTCCPKFLNDEVLHLRCHESKRKLFFTSNKNKNKTLLFTKLILRGSNGGNITYFITHLLTSTCCLFIVGPQK